MKYIEGSRTQTIEKKILETLDFPQVLFCTSQGFKAQTLKDMGLREDSLSFGQFVTHYKDFNLTDIEGLWDNATYPAEDFAVTWTVFLGNKNSDR